jgi:hypothetical protein
VCPKRFLSLWYVLCKPCTYLALTLTLTLSPTVRNEVLHDPHNLGVPSGASKMISKPMVCLGQTVHLSCVKISAISKPIEMRFHISFVTKDYHRCIQNNFGAYGTFGTNRAPILHGHYYCLQMDRNKIPHDPCHLEHPSGASKMIFEPMVRLTQTVHQSCINISTISKCTKTRFHMAQIS